MLGIKFNNLAQHSSLIKDLKNKTTFNTASFSGKLAPLKTDCVSFKATEGKVINTTGDVSITKDDGLIKSIYTTGDVTISNGARVSGDVIAKGTICINDGPIEKPKINFFELCEAPSKTKKDNINQQTIIGGNVESIDKDVYISGKGTTIKKDVSSKLFAGIAYGAIVEGSVHSKENTVALFNKGTTVKKDISGNGVYLFKAAVVEGNVEATKSNVVVNGEGTLVKGNVKAEFTVLVEEGAKVLGKITSKYLNDKDN